MAGETLHHISGQMTSEEWRSRFLQHSSNIQTFQLVGFWFIFRITMIFVYSGWESGFCYLFQLFKFLCLLSFSFMFGIYCTSASCFKYWTLVFIGIPQGSILGPFSFTIYKWYTRQSQHQWLSFILGDAKIFRACSLIQVCPGQTGESCSFYSIKNIQTGGTTWSDLSDLTKRTGP